MRHCRCKQHTCANGQRRVEKRTKQLPMPPESFPRVMPQRRKHRCRASLCTPLQVRADAAYFQPQVSRLIRRLVIGAENIPIHRYKHEAPAKPEHLEQHAHIPLNMPVKPLTIPLRLHSHQRYPPVDCLHHCSRCIRRALRCSLFLAVLLWMFAICFYRGFQYLLCQPLPFGIFQAHPETPPSSFKLITKWLQLVTNWFPLYTP